jgi:hypothetical protein
MVLSYGRTKRCCEVPDAGRRDRDIATSLFDLILMGRSARHEIFESAGVRRLEAGLGGMTGVGMNLAARQVSEGGT